MTPQNLSRNLTRSGQVVMALKTMAHSILALVSALEGEVPSVSAAILSLPPTPAPADNVSVADLVNAFLRAKAAKDCSERYLRSLRVSLLSFARGRKNLPAGRVTVVDVEHWLSAREWAPRTKRGYLADVRTCYNWGLRRNLVSHNPAAVVELPAETGRAPGILTPDQAKTVLEFARGYNLNICRALAIQFFAGLRTAEVERLEEAEIRPDIGVIEVTAAKAKCRKRRAVAIQPNLRAWLALGGALPLHDRSNLWRWFRSRLAKAHGIAWPSNAARHSFVSYHLGHFGSAARTALEAGHTEQMTFAHYRALVTPADAAAYWAIVPGDGVSRRRATPAGSVPPWHPGHAGSPPGAAGPGRGEPSNHAAPPAGAGSGI